MKEIDKAIKNAKILSNGKVINEIIYAKVFRSIEKYPNFYKKLREFDNKNDFFTVEWIIDATIRILKRNKLLIVVK